MARQPCFEYAGAVYHVMARGDGCKPIFVGKDDHESFLDWLERVCTSHGWRATRGAACATMHRPKELGLPAKREELMKLRKSDSRKVVCAARVKSRTAVANDWIAQRLAMGHPASMMATREPIAQKPQSRPATEKA